VEDIPVFTEELSCEQIKNKLYTDRLTGKPDKKELITSRDDYDQLQKIIINLLGNNVRYKRVLDLGCGKGFLSLNLLKYADFADELYALDISWVALKNFRDNIQKNRIGRKAVFLCSTAERTFLPDNYFDAVICHKFIHHVPLEPVLAEVQQVLKKGGVFICFKEPYLNRGVTQFINLYYTILNFFSFIVNKLIKRDTNRSIICRHDTKKYLYSQQTIETAAKEQGFVQGKFYYSKVFSPIVIKLVHPFELKFPRLQRFCKYLYKLAQKVDVVILEKIIPKKFFQEVSFYLTKI
jgi:ubiquinone/menaquinone biosynthesis C-methylase UbiE